MTSTWLAGRSVRIGIMFANGGRPDDVVIVALPGPTREVRAAIPALLEALAGGARSDMIAEAIADPIRALWREHHPSHEHRHEHEGGPQP